MGENTKARSANLLQEARGSSRGESHLGLRELIAPVVIITLLFLAPTGLCSPLGYCLSLFRRELLGSGLAAL